MSATNIAHSGIDTEGSARLLRQAPRRPPAYSALRDAFLSALVALGLFGPMIGLKTNAGDRGLFLTTRPLAVAIAVGRGVRGTAAPARLAGPELRQGREGEPGVRRMAYPRR